MAPSDFVSRPICVSAAAYTRAMDRLPWLTRSVPRDALGVVQRLFGESAVVRVVHAAAEELRRRVDREFDRLAAQVRARLLDDELRLAREALALRLDLGA